MRACLVLARAVIEAGPAGADAPELDLELQAGAVAFPVAGCFVSIYEEQRRRGCVGSFSPRRALPEQIARLTQVAAFEDQSASPIRRSELDRIDIAIWIVHRLLPCRSIDDIAPGVHGVCVRNGNRLGVYLPYVARKHGWTSQQLVEEACLKAGLRREMWREVDVELLEASCFGERARPW